MTEFVECNVSETDKTALVCQVSSSCYTYKTRAALRSAELNDKFMISITTNFVETKYNDIDIDVIMCNYIILNENTSEFTCFATIVWEDIKYENDDYNPYSYDPDPIFILYRDDLPKEKTNKYFEIIDALSQECYSPTSEYKHFNPFLKRVALSDCTDDKYSHIVRSFVKYMEHFDGESDSDGKSDSDEESDKKDDAAGVEQS
jgi:hypothetical protein